MAFFFRRKPVLLSLVELPSALWATTSADSMHPVRRSMVEPWCGTPNLRSLQADDGQTD